MKFVQIRSEVVQYDVLIFINKVLSGSSNSQHTLAGSF